MIYFIYATHAIVSGITMPPMPPMPPMAGLCVCFSGGPVRLNNVLLTDCIIMFQNQSERGAHQF